MTRSTSSLESLWAGYRAGSMSRRQLLRGAAALGLAVKLMAAQQ